MTRSVTFFIPRANYSFSLITNYPFFSFGKHSLARGNRSFLPREFVKACHCLKITRNTAYWRHMKGQNGVKTSLNTPEKSIGSTYNYRVLEIRIAGNDTRSRRTPISLSTAICHTVSFTVNVIITPHRNYSSLWAVLHHLPRRSVNVSRLVP